MDVYHREPLSPDDPLTALDNVILTPHIAVATRDVVRHHSRIIYNDLQLIANGEPPVHVFNSDVMPSFLAHSGQCN